MQTNLQQSRILTILPREIRKALKDSNPDFRTLQEIRLRTGKPLLFICDDVEQSPKLPYTVTRDDIRETLEYISHYSLYAYEQDMRQGFITIEGGHRVGMTGQAIIEDGKVKNLKHISSMNIRICHEILGCADRIFPYITEKQQLLHTLIVSPPKCGKTTLLRDMIRQISDGNSYLKGVSVGVVDERSEIGGCYQGVAQNQLGMRTDILDGCPKAEGMIMLIRSMSPQVVAVDEIGTAEDVHAMEYAMHCGCKMLATVHAGSMEELRKRPLFCQMIAERRFDRYVILGNKGHVGSVEGIYNERGERIYREQESGE